MTKRTVSTLIAVAAFSLSPLPGHAAPASTKEVPLYPPVTSAQMKAVLGAATSARMKAIQGAATSARRAAPGKPVRVKELGIEVTALRHTSAGHMIDFRYKVLDPEKAKPMFDKKIKPQLLDQASGTRVNVPSPPKVGSLRQTPRASKAGQVYFVIFANPGKFIKQGNKVTVVYGDYKIENLVVE